MLVRVDDGPRLAGRYGYGKPIRKRRGVGSRSYVLGKTVAPCTALPCDGSYLVDPASSHMLVSKIKPCMSKYKP
jgi:hypothetical protein